VSQYSLIVVDCPVFAYSGYSLVMIIVTVIVATFSKGVKIEQIRDDSCVCFSVCSGKQLISYFDVSVSFRLIVLLFKTRLLVPVVWFVLKI